MTERLENYRELIRKHRNKFWYPQGQVKDLVQIDNKTNSKKEFKYVYANKINEIPEHHRSYQIQVFPTFEQRKILFSWYKSTTKIYNKTVEFINEKRRIYDEKFLQT